jgi:Sulfotransferase family
VLEEKRLIEALYNSIAEASERPAVLDSSKELSVAIFLLRQVPGAKLIHFVRSPFDVVDSYVNHVKASKASYVFQMEFRVERPDTVSALLWSIQSLVCELLRLFYPKWVITIHYEDLCAEPIALLERLERFTGLSLAGAKAATTERASCNPSTLFPAIA